MHTTNYVALLRGINVGGKNIIKMTDLKMRLQEAGFRDVTTYIQSGNVLFHAPVKDTEKLAAELQRAARQAFNYTAPIVVRSHEQLKEIVEQAPKGFGTDPATYRYDVVFLKEPLTPAEALQSVTLKEGVDAVAPGPSVLYFWRLIARASQSYLPRLAGLPVYQHMTIRNWNTTTRLLALLDARPAA